ncbi:MAG: 6-carboxytetrahydropterin synthase, partial [Bacteroidales bacterium]|nr:6-carboxytetrahydropterin synthase [Bacteroidales bacterium]
MKVRITKEFTFDMAHALFEYDGLCRNIHGHTYKLQVTLKGEVNTD